MDNMKEGDTVRLRPELINTVSEPDHYTAVITVMLTSIPGGVVLDRPLHGLHYWNVSELEKVDAT